MYFNHKKEDTNIDDELKKQRKINLNFNKFKIPLIIFSIILLIGLIFIIFTNLKSKEEPIKYYVILEGTENITIYKGDIYNEPGYKGADNKRNNLTDSVVVDNQVNTNVVGEYQITYILNDIIKTRYVNVVEKPIGATSLYLKGNKTMYLNINEEYNEPGYVVIDTIDGNLKDKVNINNQVDNTIPGVYQIIYSVINSTGVTTSEIRKVIVLDDELKINLNLSNRSYTNKNIDIYINIFDEYLDYLLLPNGKKTTTNIFSYNIDKNGTYKFILYNKKGDAKEASINVTNIDKELPKGSCSGSYKNGVSTININANDNIGISKYVINGISYTSNKITLKKEITKANITIYDKAGNKNNISCTLKNNNQKPVEPQQPEKIEDPIYSQEKYHQSSINNIRYILYSQTDSRWKDVKFSQDRTIGSVGCAITSVAVISSAYDTSINPKKVFDTYRYNHPYESITNLSNNEFKCEMLNTLNTKTKITESLSKGNVIVIMVKGKNDGGSSNFTPSQHYMALIDYDKSNKKIFVGNSYGTYGYSQSGWYNEDEVITSVRQIHECIPSKTLINKFN